ncbi:hypothetical protein ACEPAF_1181 [Sanghuangporus sanghuang]
MKARYGEDSNGKRMKGYSGFTIKGLPISIFSIFLALLASMGGFIFGYDTGQISDILLMDDFLNRFGACDSNGSCHFTNLRSGLIVGLLSIGTLFGALLGAPTADYFGRRNAMSLECGVFIIGVIIQITSFNAWYQFAIGRLVAGFGVGALSAAVPMYQAETAPAQIRGTLTGTYQLFITFGILVAYCIAIGTREMGDSGSWRTVVGIGILFALFLGTTIQAMPESPRWSARHGNTEAARKAIAKVRALPEDHPIVTSELEEILDSIEIEEGVDKERLVTGDIPAKRELLAQKGDDPSKHWIREWLNCFKGFRSGTSRIGYRTLLGMSLQSLQQLTGANYFFYYGATIFVSVGISDSYVTQIILGAVNFVCTFLGLYVMERFGRRVPLIIGGIWQSFWLFVFAAAGTAKDPRTDEGIGKLMIVSACLFILGYASTWAPGIWILIGETFPTHSRAKQGAISTASNWLWNFLLAFFTPFITSAIQFRYGFVFASCNLLGAVVVYFFLYESAGMSLENVDLMYRDASAKPWRSSQWYPPGYTSRAEIEAEVQKPKRAPYVGEKDVEKQTPGAGPSNGYANGTAALGAEESRMEDVDIKRDLVHFNPPDSLFSKTKTQTKTKKDGSKMSAYDDMPGLVYVGSPPALARGMSVHPSAGGTPWHGPTASMAPTPAPVVAGGFGAGAPMAGQQNHNRHHHHQHHRKPMRRAHSTPARTHLEFPPSPTFHPQPQPPGHLTINSMLVPPEAQAHAQYPSPGGGFDPFSIPAAAYDAAAAQGGGAVPGFSPHYPWPMAMGVGSPPPPPLAMPSPYHTTTPHAHQQDPLADEEYDDDSPSPGGFGGGGGGGGGVRGGGLGAGGTWDSWDFGFRTPGSGSSAGTGPSPSASVINGFAAGPRSSYKRPEDWREGFSMSRPNPLTRVFSFGLGGFSGKPTLNRLLDAKQALCSWDVRRPPEAFHVLPSGKQLDYLQLNEGAMNPEPVRMKITHPKLPWTIHVDARSSAGGQTCIVTIGHLLSTIYGELMRPVYSRDFWNDILSEEDRKRIHDAWAARCNGDHVVAQQGIKRVDFLLDRYVFEGLRRVGDGWEMKLKSGRKLL